MMTIFGKRYIQKTGGEAVSKPSNYKILLASLFLSGACTVHDPLFCDDTHPCMDPARPYCDPTGSYDFPDHLKQSCVANPFDATPEGPPPDAPPSPAHLKFDTDTHDFHGVPTGTDSFPVQFIVTNDGELTSGTIAVSIGGANMPSFLIVPTGDSSDCAGQQLGAGKTCIVQAKYHAGAAGPESAVLHVDADPGGMPIVGLSGNSLTPGSLEVTAGATLDFSSLAIGSMSTSKTITIHNKGGVPCTNLAVVLNDATSYTKTSSTCGATLAADASCDIAVRFNPATVGTHPSSVTVTSDQGAVAPQIQGTGTGDVVVTKTGTGTVSDTLAAPIITCGASCSGTYAQTPITLHAAAMNGIPFNNWAGACSPAGTSADCTLPLTMPITSVTAKFGVCAPGTGMCTNDMVKICDATGQWSAPSACPLGCFTDGTRCWDVDPLNGLAAALDDAKSKASLTLTDGAQIDTDSGIVLNGNGSQVTIDSLVVSQAAGYPSIRVFEAKAIAIGSTTVVGTSAIAIVADQDIVVSGEIHLVTATDHAFHGQTGPGRLGCSTATGKGGTAGVSMPGRISGGGGGGFGIVGASGGYNSPVTEGAGGLSSADQSLSPLRGGCDGGTWGSTLPIGGAGGGAIQLVSRTNIKILGAGAINAGGGGAPGRLPSGLGPVYGGHGGGSGGGVVLEAPAILINGLAAAVAVNGGGGSADCDTGAGEDGHGSAIAGLGGTCSGDPTRGPGGNGSIKGMQAKVGGGFNPGSDADIGGGGGGASGVIRFDTATSSTGLTVSGGAVVSGTSSQNAVKKR